MEKFYYKFSNHELAKLQYKLNEIFDDREYYRNNQEDFLSELLNLGFTKDYLLGWLYPYNHENHSDEFKPISPSDFRFERQDKLCWTIIDINGIMATRFTEMFK